MNPRMAIMALQARVTELERQITELKPKEKKDKKK